MMDSATFLFLYFTVMVFLFGACVGSFLNVCIYRIPLEISVMKPARSYCPHCKHMIAWYDNIPMISYLWLRARCRHCKAPISVRYFLVEALVAVLFLLVWFVYGVDVRTPVYFVAVSGLVLGTFVDLEHMIIPDRVSIGGMIFGVAASVLIPALQGATGRGAALAESLIGLVVGAGTLWVVGVLGKLAFKKDAMGFGDVKLLGGMGALLGWRAVVFIIMMSSILGTLVGMGLILTHRREWQSRIPYGPYLALAAVIWILWGSRLWATYASWMAGTPL